MDLSESGNNERNLSDINPLKNIGLDDDSKSATPVFSNPLSNFDIKNENKGNFFSKFKDQGVVEGSKDFLQSNTMVAKISFILLIVIAFVALLRIGSKILGYILLPKKSPYLVSGVKSGRKRMIIEQNPGVKDSIPLLRSDNKRGGIEFTYSVWLTIDSTGGQEEGGFTRYNHIFHKGNGEMNSDGIAKPLNAPGLYYHPKENKLLVVMNSFDTIREEIVVDSVPLNKWFNVVIRCKGKIVDVYMNGTIVNRHRLNAVVRQNYGKVYVNMNGGFDGELSDLRYFNKSLTGVEIEQIIRSGPNMKADKKTFSFPPYLSLRWFFN